MRLSKLKFFALAFLFLQKALSGDAMGKTDLKFFIDDRRVTQSDFWKICKHHTYIEDKTGFELEFEQDWKNNKLFIMESSVMQQYAYLTIFYRPYGSQKVRNVTTSDFFQTTSGIMLHTKNIMPNAAEIKKVVGKKVVGKTSCSKKFTKDEITEKEAKATEYQKNKEELAQKEHQKQEIYDNCLFDKTKAKQNLSLQNSIMRICRRISENPNSWQKFWYSD